MKHLPPHDILTSGGPAAGERAGARTILLLASFFFLGIAVSAFWFYSASRRGPSGTSATTGGAPAVQLSANTRAVLARLNTPLEIRYHAALDPATVPESLIAFSGRVDQLLAAYQQAAGNKIKLERFRSSSQADSDAAFADGIPPFNLDRGNPCWLGLALVLDGHKESLPRLSPDWEPALEADLTRAIVRLLDAPHPPPAPVAVSQLNTAAVQEVKALIPNLAAVSAAEATRILREASLKDFTAATKEMEAQLKAAQERLAQAQKSGSEADQQAALAQLQKVRKEQTDKLKDIAARSRMQIDALQQLKAAP